MKECDVLIVGSGLAGLCLARQLLLAKPISPDRFRGVAAMDDKAEKPRAAA